MKRINSHIFRSKSSCKKLFIQCVCCWLNLLQWMLFIPCDNWKKSLSIKFYLYFFFFDHDVAFLFLILYVTSTITGQFLCKSFKIQLMVLYYISSIVLTYFVIWSLLLNSFPLQLFLFFYKWNLNERNLKPLGKHVFYTWFLCFYK